MKNKLKDFCLEPCGTSHMHKHGECAPKPQHTPTLYLAKQSKHYAIDGALPEMALIPKANFVTEEEAEAFGNGIVRAVNCHEELLACVKMLYAMVTSDQCNDSEADRVKKAIELAEGK
jgi:hypothetical protein